MSDMIELDLSSYKLAVSKEAAHRCGLSFNPSNDADITRVKVLATALMDEANKIFDGCIIGGLAEAAAHNAANQLEAAQMFLVKALVHKKANL